MVGGIPSTESVTEIVNFESGRTYCEEIDNKAWGYIEYATPLDPQQASDYELVLAPQKPSIPKPPLNRQEPHRARDRTQNARDHRQDHDAVRRQQRTGGGKERPQRAAAGSPGSFLG